jgi:hypothetical protein
VISTVDPEARHAHKTRSRRQDGYTAHVVVEPDTGIITDTALTPAAGPDHSDATVGTALLLEEQAGHEEPAGQDVGWEVLADSAYGTGQALTALREAGHTPIIKPWPLRPAVEGGFTIDAFTVLEPTPDLPDQPGSVTCPNGITRPITRTRNVIFGAACRDCPLRARCTNSTSGRTLRLHPHDAITRAHRARAADPQFQALSDSIGPWWNARSPGSSPAGTDGCGSAEPPATTSGYITASPRSTCADCSTSASPAPTKPGSWPDS